MFESFIWLRRDDLRLCLFWLALKSWPCMLKAWSLKIVVSYRLTYALSITLSCRIVWCVIVCMYGLGFIVILFCGDLHLYYRGAFDEFPRTGHQSTSSSRSEQVSPTHQLSAPHHLRSRSQMSSDLSQSSVASSVGSPHANMRPKAQGTNNVSRHLSTRLFRLYHPSTIVNFARIVPEALEL